nr:MAG TPA: hypothetical protein [Caudoviricetes sp.]
MHLLLLITYFNVETKATSRYVEGASGWEND